MSTEHPARLPATMLASGHLMSRDPVTGKIELQSTDLTSSLCEQFEVTRVRLGDLATWPAPSALIVAPVLYEAVLTPEALRRAVAGLPGMYACGPDVALEWSMKGGWRDRRFLTPRTLALLPSAQSGPLSVGRADWIHANRRIQEAVSISSTTEAWAAFTSQASAWWSAHLPTLLWTHCAQVVLLQALDRASWARLHSGLPLLMAESDKLELTEIQRKYFDCQLQSKDEEVLREIKRIFLFYARHHGSRQDYATKCVDDLNKLIPRAVAAGRVQVLLLGHALDLVSNGGVLGQLAISSLVNYVSQALLRVFHAILPIPIGELGPWTLGPAFRTVLKDTREGQRGKVHACLSALVDFLTWLGVPRFHFGADGFLVDRPPRARVVWTHENDRGCQALAPLALAGNRQAQQAVVVLPLLNEFMVRIEEVLSIRMGDLRRTALGYTLFLYPRTSDGRIKAGAVRRPVDIRTEAALRELHRWMSQRESEGSTPDATPSHFLFGHQRHGEQRFDPAGTYTLVEWALKVGTGSPDASSHDARHKVGSEAGAQACMPLALLSDINPVDQISAAAGQGVTHSYRETYFNTFEAPLRAHALRAMPNESDPAPPVPAWVPDVCDGIALDRDQAWSRATFKERPKARRQFEDVLEAVKDLAAGLSQSSICSRVEVDEADVPVILTTVAKALDRVRPASERLAGVETSTNLQSRTLRELVSTITLIDNKSKFAPLRAWIATARGDIGVKELLQRVILTWKPCVKEWHFSLDELEQARPMYLMLNAAKFPRRVMLVTHALELSQVPREVRDLGFHMRPEPVVRRGRPRLRLHVCSCDATDRGARDAAISMKGLYVLLATAEAWLASHEQGRVEHA
jgi:hypothetical protein